MDPEQRGYCGLITHALHASLIALEDAGGRILRICWETNGSMAPDLLEQAALLSLGSGGCIKFDLKAWSEELSVALCGASNRRTLESLRFLAGLAARRPDPPFLVVSPVRSSAHTCPGVPAPMSSATGPKPCPMLSRFAH